MKKSLCLLQEMEESGGLLQYIKSQTHDNLQERYALLGAIRLWIGENLTEGMEYTQKFKTLLAGAIYLMSRDEFDWIREHETLYQINERWKDLHNHQKYALSYGIRFSTSKPHYATFGFVHTGGVLMVRVRFTSDRLFVPEGSRKELTFDQTIQHGIDRINAEYRATHLYAHPLSLNQFQHAQLALNDYVATHSGFGLPLSPPSLKRSRSSPPRRHQECDSTGKELRSWSRRGVSDDLDDAGSYRKSWQSFMMRKPSLLI